MIEAAFLPGIFPLCWDTVPVFSSHNGLISTCIQSENREQEYQAKSKETRQTKPNKNKNMWYLKSTSSFFYMSGKVDLIP